MPQVLSLNIVGQIWFGMVFEFGALSQNLLGLVSFFEAAPTGSAICATSLRLACISLPCSALYQLLEPHVTQTCWQSLNLELGQRRQHQSRVRRAVVGHCGREFFQNETLALVGPLLRPC